MNIQEHISLREKTTFHIGGLATFFVSVTKKEEIRAAVLFAKEKNLPFFILGGGSNILVSDKGFSGVVISIELMGKEMVKETQEQVFLKIYSGEVWDDVVDFAVKHEWWGIENLSHIPGKMGSFPVQNVGAYGQEAKDVIEEVFVFDTHDMEFHVMNHKECQFGYRKSLFNSSQKGRYIILATTLRLSKKAILNISYPDMVNYFRAHDIVQPTIQQIRQAIISIRDKKIPHPRVIGNAGSFFKNVYIDEKEYEHVKEKMQESFSSDVIDKLEEMKNKFYHGDKIKIASAFLIDICELKGKRIGGAKINESQPLVIVNESGNASSEDVMNLSIHVQDVVYEKTGIRLEREPELIGF